MQQLPSNLADSPSVAVASAGPATPTALTPNGATNGATELSLPAASPSAASAAFVADSPPESGASTDLLPPSTPASPARGASPPAAAQLAATSTTSSSYHTLATSSTTTVSSQALAVPSILAGTSASARAPARVGSCTSRSLFPLAIPVAQLEKVSFLYGEKISVSL